MSGPLRSEDNDRRGEEMIADPDRYYGDAWERSRREVLAEREGPKLATLGPGIVEGSLRGDQADMEQVIAVLKAAGFGLWRADSPGTRDGNRAGYQYFTVEVPGEHRG